MPQQILIAEQLRIAAVLSDERVDELIAAQGQHQIGDIYLGTVENVHPGIDAAFVNIGESEKNGFIHVTDLGPLRLQQRAASITELLEPRQQVLVQVMKEPTGTKGPRLTGDIALPGRFLVLQPSGQGVNISRRINSESERNRLRALAVLTKPPATGLLIRTEAAGVSEDKLIEDLNILLKQWEAIQQAAANAQPPVLLNRDDDFVQRTLRDHYCPNLKRVLVDSKEAAARAKAFLGSDAEAVVVEHLADAEQLLEQFRVNATIVDALKPRVNLPSGGYVVIEPTEAMTVIDVNSGSFTRSANARETVLWTNCEAATEIARQLQLRNIGGMVIVDFIDMDSRRDQLLLLEHFTKAMRDDKARPQIAQLTELGLVELTRKRLGQNIYEVFSRHCPSCGGLGHMVTLPGQEQLQPLATLPGIVRATTLTPTVPDAAVSPDASNGSGRRRRRGGRGSLATAEPAAAGSEVGGDDAVTEASTEAVASRPSDPEVVMVPMDAEQELVYGWMGLSPVLLADAPPADPQNVVARVVGPGDNVEELLADAKEQMVSNLPRRRRQRSITNDIKTNEDDLPATTSTEQLGEKAADPSPHRGRTRSRRRATEELPATEVANQQQFAETAIPTAPTSASEPVAAPAPMQTPEPVVTSAPTSAPEPVATPAPVRTPEPVAASAPTSAPEPVAAPASVRTSAPVPQLIAIQPKSHPATTESMGQSIASSAIEPDATTVDIGTNDGRRRRRRRSSS